MKKYDKVMMDTAFVWAEMSYCKRSKVGAILSIDSRIISNGYNGTITGEDNNCEEVSDNYGGIMRTLAPKGYSEEESKKYIEDRGFLFVGIEKYSEYSGTILYKEKLLVSKNTVVHAEANALMFACKNGISTDGATMYVTLSPCIECSKLMFQAGIKRVVYSEDYRISDGIEFLKKHGMIVEKIEV